MELQAGLVEVASGVDALYLSGRAHLPRVLVEDLEELRKRAGEKGKYGSEALSLGGDEFAVKGHGWGKYRFALEHRYGLVQLTTSAELPTVRIQPRSGFIHGAGVEKVVPWFTEQLGACTRTDRILSLAGGSLHRRDGLESRHE